jgi:hypothetical protein
MKANFCGGILGVGLFEAGTRVTIYKDSVVLVWFPPPSIL